jgi:hypothetical protein
MEWLLENPVNRVERVLVFDATKIRADDGKLLVEASTAQWLCTWTRTLEGR